MSTTTRRGTPWLMGSVAFCAVALSSGLAVTGVIGVIGWGSPLALVGTVALVAGTLLTETAAVRLPVHAEARAVEGSKLKAVAVALGFLVLTAWNVAAAHMGVSAIDRAGVSDKRAPLERALAEAGAGEREARAAVEAFDAVQERTASALSSGLQGAMASGYVTASMRSFGEARGTEEASLRRRTSLASALARAEARRELAQAALARAPGGRADWELWLFAGILELLKGALVWFATGRERREHAERSAEIVALAPKSLSEMTSEELATMASRGASLAASARHEQNRRKVTK